MRLPRNSAIGFALAVLAACSGSGGDGGDSGPENPPFSELPAEEWSWLEVPGMVCGNGSPTGIAVNPSASNRLVVLFEGGGAYWEPATCYGIGIQVTAVHLDGFDAQTFESVRASALDPSVFFQREAGSEFADDTWVFVPYCTGDLHAGSQQTIYEALNQQRTMHHVGATNVARALETIAAGVDATGVESVFAIGVSAGGYGAQIHWDRIAAAFPGADTHVLADGAQLVDVESSRWGAIVDRWAPSFPPGCGDCRDGLSQLSDHLADTPSGGRHGLLASLEDGIIGLFFGLDGPTMNARTTAIVSSMSGDRAAFVVAGSEHTMLGRPQLTTGGVGLRDWVRAWRDGGAEFRTVGP